jgi:hypothetical protein
LKTEQTENGNFSLLAANGKCKWQTSISLLQTDTENEICFPWSSNDKWLSKIAVSSNMPTYAQ